MWICLKRIIYRSLIHFGNKGGHGCVRAPPRLLYWSEFLIYEGQKTFSTIKHMYNDILGEEGFSSFILIKKYGF